MLKIRITLVTDIVHGEGKAAAIISRVLAKAPLGQKLLFKHAELL